MFWIFTAPGLVLGHLYHYLGEDLKLLWSRDLKMNTLHVNDLARAIWHVLPRDDTVGQVSGLNCLLIITTLFSIMTTNSIEPPLNK